MLLSHFQGNRIWEMLRLLSELLQQWWRQLLADHRALAFLKAIIPLKKLENCLGLRQTHRGSGELGGRLRGDHSIKIFLYWHLPVAFGPQIQRESNIISPQTFLQMLANGCIVQTVQSPHPYPAFPTSILSSFLTLPQAIFFDAVVQPVCSLCSF